jgi:hypothetical protein
MSGVSKVRFRTVWHATHRLRKPRRATWLSHAPPRAGEPVSVYNLKVTITRRQQISESARNLMRAKNFSDVA